MGDVIKPIDNNIMNDWNIGILVVKVYRELH